LLKVLRVEGPSRTKIRTLWQDHDDIRQFKMTEQLTIYFASNFRATTTEIEQLASAFKVRAVKKNES
jgi:hypothetical protein